MVPRLLLTVATILAAFTAESAGQAPVTKRNQFTIDVGFLDLGVGYGQRVGTGRVSVGGGVWGAWEAPATFHRHFFEARGVELFARYQFAPAFQAEAGPSFLRFQYADDCSKCTGTFLGVRFAALAGRRILVGPTVRFGRASGGPESAETGFVLGFAVRFLFQSDD